jgi:hypothetical protein
MTGADSTLSSRASIASCRLMLAPSAPELRPPSGVSEKPIVGSPADPSARAGGLEVAPRDRRRLPDRHELPPGHASEFVARIGRENVNLLAEPGVSAL